MAELETGHDWSPAGGGAVGDQHQEHEGAGLLRGRGEPDSSRSRLGRRQHLDEGSDRLRRDLEATCLKNDSNCICVVISAFSVSSNFSVSPYFCTYSSRQV